METIPLVERDYYTLVQALNVVGTELFGPSWTNKEIAAESMNDVPGDEVMRALVDRFEAARLELFEALHNEHVHAKGLSIDGKTLQTIDAYRWKDVTGAWTVDIEKGRAYERTDDKTIQWRIRVDRAGLNQMIQKSKARTSRASKNKGGRPTTHKWDEIGRLVDIEYRGPSPPTSIYECDRRIRAWLKSTGEAVPPSSAVRAYISQRVSTRAK